MGDQLTGKSGGIRENETMQGKKESPVQGCILILTTEYQRLDLARLPREQIVYFPEWVT